MSNLPVLAADDLRKLVGVASRMASPHDGEALNAARMTVRHLDRHSIRIEDVIGAAFAPRPVVESFRPWSPEPMYATASHQRIARLVLAAARSLEPHEADFVNKMTRQARKPSPRQMDWLLGLHDRWCGVAA